MYLCTSNVYISIYLSRTVLREIKKKGIRNIVVDTDPNNINYFFRVVLQLQMNNNKFHYMFTSFDVET